MQQARRSTGTTQQRGRHVGLITLLPPHWRPTVAIPADLRDGKPMSRGRVRARSEPQHTVGPGTAAVNTGVGNVVRRRRDARWPWETARPRPRLPTRVSPYCPRVSARVPRPGLLSTDPAPNACETDVVATRYLVLRPGVGLAPRPCPGGYPPDGRGNRRSRCCPGRGPLLL